MNLGNLPIMSAKCAAQLANRKSTVTLIAGLVAGVAVGAAVGLLLAPQSGAETRQQLKDKGTELAGTVKEKATKVVDTVKNKVDEIKGKKCCDDVDACECETTED